VNKTFKNVGGFFCTLTLIALCYPQIGNGISNAQSNETNSLISSIDTASNENNNSNSAANKSSKKTVAKSIDGTNDATADIKSNNLKADSKIEKLKNAAPYSATAYALRGKTASGQTVRRGIIAADPRHLPLGTRVQLSAGTWSGTYLVADTGGVIRGRKIDVWVPNNSEARKFGRRKVQLTVLSKSR
jgi:3D (Asp-Asp-Asp) domain-containing protein